jgi:DNA-binding HxlR family transcriptional regulator
VKRNAKSVATVCPVARSVDVVGDKWTLLVLREMYMGATRFEEIQIQTEATPQMLASRLKALEANGMIERHPYSQRPLRYEYRLTEKGKAFYPVVRTLRAWGETWCKSRGEDIAVRFTHRACGQDVGLGDSCPVCGTAVERSDLVASLSDAFEKEREERKIAFKEGKL